MSQQAAEKPNPNPNPRLIEVKVSFPISPAGPWRGEHPAHETIGTLDEQAMRHFGVASDTQHSYYLTHDGKQVEDSHTIGEVAGTAPTMKLTLVKELVQG